MPVISRANLLIAPIAACFALMAPTAASAQPSVKAGMLTCYVSSGVGYVVASTKNVDCNYVGLDGTRETYGGEISKYGIDIGATGVAVMYWTVFAPTVKLERHALAGSYGGVTAGAVFGVGAGANILIGGSGKTVQLQPFSGQVEKGINLVVGVASLTLQ